MSHSSNHGKSPFELNQDQLNCLRYYDLISKNNDLKKLAERVSADFQSQTLSPNDMTTIENVDQESKNLFSEILQKSNESKPVVIYMDGVFDIIHSGHFNAIRQAKKLGDILLVGVNSDEEVHKSKGPTLMNTAERTILASACKWADKALEGTPYTPTIELLDKVGADFGAHGDDIAPNENGVDCYQAIKDKGRMKIFKRTSGVSTTELLGRLLRAVESQDEKKSNEKEEIQSTPILSNFLTTGWRLNQFSSNKLPKTGQKVVYLDGNWDLLHVGHIDILEKAKSKGDFLYVGVFNDSLIQKEMGRHYPIMNMQERVLNILALKYVDDVVIGCPWIITENMMDSLNIDTVLSLTNKKDSHLIQTHPRLEIPKKLNKLEFLYSEYSDDNQFLIDRLKSNKAEFIRKYNIKSIKESNYYINAKQPSEI